MRDGVWTCVRGEREVGVVPGVVILALTDMVERAKIVPNTARDARTREVILWCVEAYFGRRGGAPDRRDREVYVRRTGAGDTGESSVAWLRSRL